MIEDGAAVQDPDQLARCDPTGAQCNGNSRGRLAVGDAANNFGDAFEFEGPLMWRRSPLMPLQPNQHLVVPMLAFGLGLGLRAVQRSLAP